MNSAFDSVPKSAGWRKREHGTVQRKIRGGTPPCSAILHFPKPYSLHHKKSISQPCDLTHIWRPLRSNQPESAGIKPGIRVHQRTPDRSPSQGKCRMGLRRAERMWWKNNEKPLWERPGKRARGKKERGIVLRLHAQLVRVAILNSIHSDGSHCVGQASDAFPCCVHNRRIDTAPLRDICAQARIRMLTQTLGCFCVPAMTQKFSDKRRGLAGSRMRMLKIEGIAGQERLWYWWGCDSAGACIPWGLEIWSCVALTFNIPGCLLTV